jgi:hypothetical protein
MSTCNSASAEHHEPLAATAATAKAWLLLEQPGPWGATALTHSRLDPEVGRRLEADAAQAGVRVALIRRPGWRTDSHQRRARTVYAASTTPGAGPLRVATVDDPAQLLDWDLAAIASYGLPYDGDPLALVCTNGTRDRCCALHGRRLATELSAAGAGNAWEVTHIGGHRFAPTMLVLPYGYVYGRMDAHRAKEVVEAARAGRVLPDGCRGRSTYDRPGQAADLAVRALTGEDRADALSVEGTRVRHRDGRAWDVAVAERQAGSPRPESCGAALGRPSRMDVLSVTSVTAPS